MRYQGNEPSRKETRRMERQGSQVTRRTIKRDAPLATQLLDASLITYASSLNRPTVPVTQSPDELESEWPLW